MAATYTRVHLQAMCELLRPDKGWVEVEEHAKEYVFDFPLTSRPGVVIRVYTSIDKRTAEARRCGGDAIRVCAVNTRTNRGLVKSRRVHRTQGWRDNLKSRVLDAIKLAKERV
jgi:hypothetical protein